MAKHRKHFLDRAEKIRKIKQFRHLSQKEAAKRCGIGERQLRRWFRQVKDELGLTQWREGTIGSGRTYSKDKKPKTETTAKPTQPSPPPPTQPSLASDLEQMAPLRDFGSSSYVQPSYSTDLIQEPQDPIGFQQQPIFDVNLMMIPLGMPNSINQAPVYSLPSREMGMLKWQNALHDQAKIKIGALEKPFYMYKRFSSIIHIRSLAFVPIDQRLRTEFHILVNDQGTILACNNEAKKRFQIGQPQEPFSPQATLQSSYNIIGDSLVHHSEITGSQRLKNIWKIAENSKQPQQVDFMLLNQADNNFERHQVELSILAYNGTKLLSIRSINFQVLESPQAIAKAFDEIVLDHKTQAGSQSITTEQPTPKKKSTAPPLPPLSAPSDPNNVSEQKYLAQNIWKQKEQFRELANRFALETQSFSSNISTVDPMQYFCSC